MKIKFVFLIVFVFLGATVTNAQPGQAAGAKPFHFSSRQSGFGVQGDFEGTYLIRDYAIEVNVTKATIYVSEHCPYQGRRSINWLKFGLVKDLGSEGRWKIETFAPPVALTLIMSPKEEYSFYNLYFVVPKERDADLTQRWFVAEIQTDAVDLPIENKTKGYVYAHSRRDIFLHSADESKQ